MNSYETTGTVEQQGEIHVIGVPFAPGTEVEITISAKQSSEDAKAKKEARDLNAARARMSELFAKVRGFRMTQKISREDLYER